jgi:hypothetical protein
MRINRVQTRPAIAAVGVAETEQVSVAWRFSSFFTLTFLFLSHRNLPGRLLQNRMGESHFFLLTSLDS